MDFRVTAAIDFAKRAHEGQTRKYTNEPYVSHPIAVAGLVASVVDNEDMFIAAILHDVVEDTDVKIETIMGIFGVQVASYVADLTDTSKPEDGNRAKRKKIDRIHTSNASNSAKTIKLADLIDNTKSIVSFDPKFAKVYMAEKRELLKVLKDGDKVLFKIADDIVRNYYKAI
jgi:(p)ppGpp synthase/HD superfamily hydrolase